MYAVYQKAIKQYILHKMNATYIQYINGELKLIFPSYSCIGIYDNYIELQDTNKILLCVMYMFEFLNIKKYFSSLNGTSLIQTKCVNNKTGTIMMYEKRDFVTHSFVYWLNEYPMYVKNNSGGKQISLLLFLVDPLEYIKRGAQEIAALDDVDVKAFLFELKCCAENMKVMHIKYWAVINMDLVDDMAKVIGEKYIDLIFDRNSIRECLLGDKKLKI